MASNFGEIKPDQMHVSLHAVEAHSHRWFTKRKAEAPNMPFQRHSNAQPPPPHESRNKNHSQLDHTTSAFAPQKSSKGLATRFKSPPNPLTLLGDRNKTQSHRAAVRLGTAQRSGFRFEPACRRRRRERWCWQTWPRPFLPPSLPRR